MAKFSEILHVHNQLVVNDVEKSALQPLVPEKKISLKSIEQVPDLDKILEGRSFKNAKGTLCAILLVKTMSSATPFWVLLTTLNGCDVKTGYAVQYWNNIVKFIRNFRLSLEPLAPLFIQGKLLYKENPHDKGQKLDCIITAFNPSLDKPYEVTFRDGTKLLVDVSEFVSNITAHPSVRLVHKRWITCNNQLKPEIFASLSDLYGPFDVDACAEPDGENSLCDTFWSRDNSALKQDWKGLNVWCNPPYDNIEAYLRKFLHSYQSSPSNTSAIFILPRWTTASWWPLTDQLLESHTHDIGSDLFLTPDQRNDYGKIGPIKWPVTVFTSKPYAHTLRLNLVKIGNMSAVGDSFKSGENVVLQLAEHDLPSEKEFYDYRNSEHYLTMPTSVHQISKRLDKYLFKEATEVELNKIVKFEIGDWITLPKGKKAVDSKFVYKIKLGAITSPQQKIADLPYTYKARLVAKGYSQSYGIDYTETFSPVIQLTALRVFLALVVSLDLKYCQLDVEGAFLNAPLKENIFLRMPPGFRTNNKNGDELYLKLKKSLYGLKQASHEWNKMILEKLLLFGFQVSKIDPCFLVYEKDGITVYIGLYVDDIPVGYNSDPFILKLLEYLQTFFTVTVVYDFSQLLGMGMTREENCLLINNSRMISELSETYKNVLKVNKSNVPLSKSFQVSDFDSPQSDAEKAEVENIPYRNLLGALNWICRCSRPDISAAVGILGRYCANPSIRHWKALLGVLSYLVSTQDRNLVFHKQDNFDLYNGIVAFSDADYGTDVSSSKSTSGFCIFFIGCLISWGTKKQDVIALSSTEAEYYSMGNTGKEVEYSRNLLESINLKQSGPTRMYFDNTSADFLAKHETTNPATKHIRIRFHYIRELISEGVLITEYCNTKKMLADMFTKPLIQSVHSYLSGIVMNTIKSTCIFKYLSDMDLD